MNQISPSKCVAISLALHICAAISLFFFAQKNEPIKPDERIDLVIIEKSPPVIPQLQTKEQIVEQELKELQKKADENAKYISEQNQTAEKETQAEQLGKFNNSDVEQSQKNEVVEEKKELLKNTDQTETLAEESDIEVEKKETNANSEQAEASSNDDYLKDLERAKKTILATKEFANYSYFKKIKDRIQQHWESAIKAKIIDLINSDRSIASVNADHRTRLLIILDRDGVLLGVRRLNNSIEEDLDNTAVDAFREASPFPPPPESLLGRDGTVKIRWDFVVER